MKVIAVKNGCLNLTMLCLNLSDVSIITVKGLDYCCIIQNISKSEEIYFFLIDDCGYI